MPLNPVERRLALLCGEWIDFRDDATKRLLVWRIPENAMRLVQCFFEAQKHDLEYSSHDLFVVFDTPFEHSIQYSRALKEALRGQFEASVEELAVQGFSTDWPFQPTDVPDSTAGFLDALRAFGSKYHKTIGHLTAVMLPSEVSDSGAFAAWMLRLLAANLPERLRLLVVDSLEHRRLPGLTPDRDARICVQQPAIDALTTAQETFAQEHTTGPAGVYRNLMMGVVTLLEKGSANQVKAKATDALTFARTQGWSDQEVVIRVLVAGALLKESRHKEAVQVYRAARQTAERTVAAAHPAGQKLVLQTWFGEAGVCLAADDPMAAARCYDEAAVVAQADRDSILALEAFRMSAFCHARAGDMDAAIERGRCAMAIGEPLKADARGLTTLPLAAVELLRAIEPDRVRGLEASKARLDARVSQARHHAESRAVAIESQPDSALANEIESELARETAHARAEAEREIEPLVSAASVPFREQFTRARELLGPIWPLHSPLALLPPSPPPAQGTPS